MNEARDFVPIKALVGMPVLSRASGNKLGMVRDLSIDPANGVLNGLVVAITDRVAALPYEAIYSFGYDAIMAESDDSLRASEGSEATSGSHAKEHLIGTKVLTESGRLLGNISNVFVTLKNPPFIVYEIRESVLDKLLGRQLYILSSGGYALSDDAERLVVPEEAAEAASSNITELINRTLTVRTFSPTPGNREDSSDEDRTWVRPGMDEDETIIRVRDEEETILRPPRTAE
jgi:uncharacterized protein YrrD